MSGNRPQSISAQAPPGYVPGLGRGATGFTTRSDIGPARSAAESEPDKRGSRSSANRSAMLAKRAKENEPKQAAPEDNDDDEKDENEEDGEDSGIFFNSADYDEEDAEADKVFESIDNKMASRRKERREARLREELLKFRAERPKIQQQFADLKEKLSMVSEDEWQAIPDIADYTIKRQKRPERYTPAPDSLLMSARTQAGYSASVDPRQQRTGLETPMTPVTDINQVGKVQQAILAAQMDRTSDSVTGQTNVDPKGYLTNLINKRINQDIEIGDLRKARLLLKSVRTTNPGHAAAWIASAKLEEIGGKISTARSLINQACEMCPTSDEIWLQAIRLQPPSQAKMIAARAVTHIRGSVKIWLKAAELEDDTKNKKRVFRKALEYIPNSVELWRAAIELEEPDDARILLSRAVECVPDEVDLWLALARLETYEEAKKVLNRARHFIPTNPLIWITAARLEEANGNLIAVEKTIQKAIKSLQAKDVTIHRDTWIDYATNAERSGSIACCQALIRCVIGIGVENIDRKATWKDDAKKLLESGHIESARAVYGHALSVLPQKKSLWIEAARLEKQHGTSDALETLLKKSVVSCPRSDILWLMYAKEKLIQGDVNSARAILDEALRANPKEENIWLAAVKLESENNEPERARMILQKAREAAGTQRIWMRSALLARHLKDYKSCQALLVEALKLYPTFYKLWIMRAQIEDVLGNRELARDTYLQGIRQCPHSIPLRLCAVDLEKNISMAKARAMLETARLRITDCPELWRASIRIEVEAGNSKAAEALLARALQEYPSSGLLRAESILMAPRPQRKMRLVDALKKCENDPFVCLEVAKLFWSDRKLEKARSWFNRVVTINPDYGDAWANYYKFMVQFGTEDEQNEVIRRCKEAEPRHGEVWQKVSKADENWLMKTEQILKKVAALV